jgi:hypothetical protein
MDSRRWIFSCRFEGWENPRIGRGTEQVTPAHIDSSAKRDPAAGKWREVSRMATSFSKASCTREVRAKTIRQRRRRDDHDMRCLSAREDHMRVAGLVCGRLARPQSACLARPAPEPKNPGKIGRPRRGSANDRPRWQRPNRGRIGCTARPCGRIRRQMLRACLIPLLCRPFHALFLRSGAHSPSATPLRCSQKHAT